MAATADVILPFSIRQGVERDSDIKHVVQTILGGAWLELSPRDISLSALGGGITNLLFKIQGTPEIQPVVVRIYGEDTDILIDRERDNNLFHELSTLGYAPPYLGRFINGRIEGYLHARALEPQEMGYRSPIDFVSLIAREMARMHRLSVTKAGPRRGAELWGTLSRWLALARGIKFDDEAKAAAVSKLDLDWVAAEVAWIEKELRMPEHGPSRAAGGDGRVTKSKTTTDSGADAAVISHFGNAHGYGSTAASNEGAQHSNESATPLAPRSNGANDGETVENGLSLEERAKRYLSEVVLSHNDLLSGNVIHGDGWDRVQVIDYEYSGYNYRGFDIANHFCEHAGFDSDFRKRYPSHETQTAFLQAYVKAATQDNTGGGDSGPLLPENEEAFVAALRNEVDRWTLPSHLWWASWAVVQARYSPVDFDFADYARLRLEGYILHKQAFFGDEGAM